jgi:hypothetical protein
VALQYFGNIYNERTRMALRPGMLSRYSDWVGSNPGRGEIFTHVQIGPGAHSASCRMGTGFFLGVKRPGRGAHHPLLLVPMSRKSRAIPLPPSGPSSLLRRTFTFTYVKR